VTSPELVEAYRKAGLYKRAATNIAKLDAGTDASDRNVEGDDFAPPLGRYLIRPIEAIRAAAVNKLQSTISTG